MNFEKLTDADLKSKLYTAAEDKIVVQQEMQVISNKYGQILDTWKQLNEEFETRKFRKIEDRNIFALLNTDDDSTARHKARQKFLQSLGLLGGGYWSQNNQATVSFSLTKKDSNKNKKTIKGIKTILPHVLPHEFKCNDIIKYGKPFKLREDTLSQYGTYTVYIVDHTVYLCKTAYGRAYTKDIGNFDDAMKYIQQHHPYN